MNVELCHFPETKIAVIEHTGAPEKEHQSIKKLTAWRIENNLTLCTSHQNYGLYYNDPTVVQPQDYRVDLCLSVTTEIRPNKYDVIAKTIPKCRCAKVRHIGSRKNLSAVHSLYKNWLDETQEELGEFPMFFHYVDIGIELKEHELITDIYLPLKQL